MPLDSRLILANLQKKGFKSTEGGSHIKLRYYTENNEMTAARTILSRGHAQIADNIISQMSKQCFLNNSEFKKLSICTMDRAQYEKILKFKNLI